MLKIRIAGTESELRQIAHKVGTTHIKRFKRDNGKTIFVIDVQISVNDFLEAEIDLQNAVLDHMKAIFEQRQAALQLLEASGSLTANAF